MAGIPTPERARRLVEHIFDESEFWTAAPLPSIWQKDPAVRDDVYWRGRMWPPLNFFTYLGLKRYGFQEEAHRLAQRSAQVFARAWEEERACYENYNTFTGVGKSVDAEPFYGWALCLPLMWVLEFVRHRPRRAVLSFGSISGEAMQLQAHLRTYLGQMELRLGDAAQVDLDGRPSSVPTPGDASPASSMKATTRSSPSRPNRRSPGWNSRPPNRCLSA